MSSRIRKQRVSANWRLHYGTLLLASGLMLGVTHRSDAQERFVFDRVNIGGGGYNSGILIHPATPDLIYARQDVSGLLRWDATGQKWIQVLDTLGVDKTSAKACDGFAVDTAAGSDATRQNTIYAAVGTWGSSLQMSSGANGVYRSTDRGETWTQIWNGSVRYESGWIFSSLSFGANMKQKMSGECLAVDPANPNILYAGTRNDGLWRSTNARAASPTFSKISGAPSGHTGTDYSGYGVRIVHIDPSGGRVDVGTSNERSKLVYIGLPDAEDQYPAFTGGVWRSTDGGNNFTRLSGTNSPKYVTRIVPGPNNSILVNGDGIRKWNGSSWSVLGDTGGKWWNTIATDPANRNRIVIMGGNKELWRSTDGGATWDKCSWDPTNDGVQTKMNIENVNWTYRNFLGPHNSSSAVFDPHRPGHLWYGSVFEIGQTTDVWASTINIKPRLKGHETTVTWSVCAPAAGNLRFISSCADVAGHVFNDVTQMPSKAYQLSQFALADDPKPDDALISDVEYAPSDPLCLAVLKSSRGSDGNDSTSAGVSRIYLSTNGGQNWFKRDVPAADVTNYWTSKPGPAKIAISVTDKNKAVYWGAFRYPKYTTNLFSGNPVVWNTATGIPDDFVNEAGSGFFWADSNGYQVNGMRLIADGRNGNTFYIRRPRKNAPAEIWRSTNGGASWSKPSGQTTLPQDAGIMASSNTPDRTSDAYGELFVTFKWNGLYRSSDGGVTFTKNPKVTWATGVAFGKKAPDSNYPTLFVTGRVDDGASTTDGVFLSKNMGQSFIRMTPANKPWIGGIDVTDMCGDAREYGRVYIGTGGTGVVYGALEGSGSSGENLVSNPSFDAENYDTQTPSGWSEWSDNNGNDASYTETKGGGASGARHLTHWKGSAYRVYTYQTKTGLANGLYTLRAKFKSSGAQCVLNAKDFNSSNSSRDVYTYPAYNWTSIQITDINVANGRCTIGIWSNAGADNWAYFDDVEFFKQ